MALWDWLKSMRHAEPLRAAEIRRRLHEARELQAVAVRQRDLVALDAVHDEVSAHRWQALDGAAHELDKRIAVLAAALPQAEAREHEAAEREELAARTTKLRDYDRQTAEAQAWLEDVLGRLPDGETLTRARDLRRQLAADARDLATWANDARVRRPLDPLEAIGAAMQHRIDRISRERLTRGSPITLRGAEPATLLAAIERVDKLLEKDAHVV
jgi:hypothetical protein